MTHPIDALVGAFEAGKLTRRELVAALVAVPAAAMGGVAAAADSPFAGATINHATFTVTDLKRSTEFYERLLGLKFLHEIGGNNYLGLGDGKSFLCLTPARQGAAPMRVDHLSVGIENFDAERVMDRLKQEKLETRTNPKGEVYFLDPDGLRVQLSSTTYNGEGPG